MVYILKSEKDRGYYYGYTSNLANRVEYHNQGLVRSTKSRIPFMVHYTEKLILTYAISDWYSAEIKSQKFPIFIPNSGCSAVGSVHVWGAWGRWFESSHPDTWLGAIGSFFRFVSWRDHKNFRFPLADFDFRSKHQKSHFVGTCSYVCSIRELRILVL